MPGKLLDTNIIIRYIKGEGGLDDIFEEESLYFSSITLGELLFGRNAPRGKRRISPYMRDSAASLRKSRLILPQPLPTQR